MNDALERSMRAYAGERGFHDDTVARWISLADADAAALWELTTALRLGENQLLDLWNWAEEIAARDRIALAEVLNGDAVLAARRTSGGRNDRLKALKSCLRRLRFPSLVRAEEQLASLIDRLDLPRSVKLSVPDFPEADEVRVEIVARDATALRAAAERLAAIASSAACQEIFDLLSEAPEPEAD